MKATITTALLTLALTSAAANAAPNYDITMPVSVGYSKLSIVDYPEFGMTGAMTSIGMTINRSSALALNFDIDSNSYSKTIYNSLIQYRYMSVGGMLRFQSNTNPLFAGLGARLVLTEEASINGTVIQCDSSCESTSPTYLQGEFGATYNKFRATIRMFLYDDETTVTQLMLGYDFF